MIEKIIDRALNEQRKVYIFSHLHADGDALNSASALKKYLEANGVDAYYIISKVVGPFKPARNIFVKEGLCVVVDTSTLANCDNGEKILRANKNNIFVFDHHDKPYSGSLIEEELDLPKENVVRVPHATSASEVLLNDFNEKKISPKIATYLLKGLISDTENLKYINSESILNTLKLLSLNANLEIAVNALREGGSLKFEVGISKELLSAEKIDFGGAFGIFKMFDNEKVNILNNEFGVFNPQRQVKKLADMENCAFWAFAAENEPGKFDVELRSNPSCGNFNVLDIAGEFGGGGHYNASGFTVSAEDGFSLEKIKEALIEKVSEVAKKTDKALYEQNSSELEEKLQKIMEKTDYLTHGTTPKDFAEIYNLVKAGVHYHKIRVKPKTYGQIMFAFEVLSKIPESVYSNQFTNLKLNFDEEMLKYYQDKYNITEDDVLGLIDNFKKIAVPYVEINLPNGKTTNRTLKINPPREADFYR